MIGSIFLFLIMVMQAVFILMLPANISEFRMVMEHLQLTIIFVGFGVSLK